MTSGCVWGGGIHNRTSGGYVEGHVGFWRYVGVGQGGGSLGLPPAPAGVALPIFRSCLRSGRNPTVTRASLQVLVGVVSTQKVDVLQYRSQDREFLRRGLRLRDESLPN